MPQRYEWAISAPVQVLYGWRMYAAQRRPDGGDQKCRRLHGMEKILGVLNGIYGDYTPEQKDPMDPWMLFGFMLTLLNSGSALQLMLAAKMMMAVSLFFAGGRGGNTQGGRYDS